ncbi:MAG: hypothetical protein H8E12_16945 [Rhodobacteraceae bacterium]|nr:hypothetical protein [Paracoccaceae bacterium]
MVSSTIFMKRNDTRPFLDTVLQDVDGLALDLSGSEVKTIKFTMVDADSFIIKVNNSSNVSLLPPDDGVSDDGSDGKVRYS